MHLSTCMHPKIKYEEEWINFFKMCLYTSTCTQKSNMMKNGKWINFSKRLKKKLNEKAKLRYLYFNLIKIS